MGRLSAIFVAICMVLIAGSIGAVLYLRFGLSGPESAVIALAALTGLAIYNGVTGRTRDRGDFDGQVGDLARGTTDLARQVAELSRRLAAIEGKTKAAVETTLAATAPINAEIGEVGGLIQQIAETVAAHDNQLKVLTPSQGTPPPATAVPPPAGAPAVLTAHEVPIAPLVAALPVEGEAPKADVKASEMPPPEPAFYQPKIPEPAAAAAAPPPPAAPGTTKIVSGRFKDMEQDAVIAMIREAVDANRVDLFLQPIVTLPQRKVRYYEAVARLRAGEGEPIMAGDFLPYAEAGGLMPKIDNLMMFRCVQVVRRLLAKNREIGLFCNLSTTTLVDSETFPQFTEFMDANKAIAPALVFEFTQPALRQMGPMENESLAALAQRGYRFSLDNVTDLRFEPRDLAERGFRFVKVQASLLLNRTGISLSDIAPQDFAGLLARHGIELIAAKLESEAVVVDLLDYDVKFAQGFLFSPPRPVRPEVMQGIGDRSGDVVATDAPPVTAAPAAPAAPAAAAAPAAPATGEAPAVSHRVGSLAALARGTGARS